MVVVLEVVRETKLNRSFEMLTLVLGPWRRRITCFVSKRHITTREKNKYRTKKWGLQVYGSCSAFTLQGMKFDQNRNKFILKNQASFSADLLNLFVIRRALLPKESITLIVFYMA